MNTSAKYSVLVVDDEEFVRECLVFAFESGGFQVAEAADVDTALELLKTRSFDAVVSDVRMPGRDGLALLREIRLKYAPPPVVTLITGHTEYDFSQFLKEGAAAVFSKPIEWDALCASIMNEIEKAKKKQSSEREAL